jgi:hypothetical protein
MAGSAVITHRTRYRAIKWVQWDWTSDASGDVDGAISAPINGEIMAIDTVPGAGGVQPTDNYGITLLDENGVDVAEGLLADRDNATSQRVLPVIEQTVGSNPYGFRAIVDGPLELVVVAAGAANEGRVRLYYR